MTMSNETQTITRKKRGPVQQHGHCPGHRASPTYSTWQSMIQRCTNPKRERWARYGGRGIAVCEEWRFFKNFLADMGERPEGKTLDRIDNNGNYEPANCRWATNAQQHANMIHRSTKKPIDMTGQKHGRLTVISFSHRGTGRESFWQCLCDCGNAHTTARAALVSGGTKSCGCLRLKGGTR